MALVIEPLEAMEKRSSILIVDDDADWLDVCKELLGQLPSKPEIRTVGAGTRAIAQLDAQPCRLLICDLKMPRMDGLQVLAVVRRRFPDLRTVVLTGMEGEEFRSRAYALGVDMFWLKSEMQQNLKMFLDCMESLLGRDNGGGFRGIQSKSLMDILQLECMSRNSTVLQITRGPLVGKIWVRDGDLVDAEVGNARGEPAFHKILGWKSGTFENRPPEPERERTIFKSANALLLESAQALDEMNNPQTEFIERASHQKNVWRLSLLAAEGAEFVVTAPADAAGKIETIGTASAEAMATWARRAVENSKRLSERLGAGPLSHLAGGGLQLRLLALPRADKTFLVGWPADTDDDHLLERSKKLAESWES